jgi:hypothetical protein
MIPAPRIFDTMGDDLMRPCSLVWIDSRAAVIARWEDDHAIIERLESDVPAHHRTTGHIRHEPGIRHGGGGPPQTAGEPRRLEHLERFVDQVAARLSPADLLILGPGTVRERLERHVRDEDERHGRSRIVTTEASPPLTGRQLIARLRHLAGADPRRRTLGAYRWSAATRIRRSGRGRAMLEPRRVGAKPPRGLHRSGR